MDNLFECKSGEQNNAQGDGAIGKQVNNYGISPEVFAEYAGKLAITDSALSSFFAILEEQQVLRSDLDSKLREIAGQYKELLLRMETVQSEDPQVVKLKQEAKQAIETSEYAKAEELLNDAEARDMEAIEKLDKQAVQIAQAARLRHISAAASNMENAILQDVQLRYTKAAEYWQKAVCLLPEDCKKKRSYCLTEAGYNFQRVSRYGDALPLYEQSLAIQQGIGDKAGEGAALNNIGDIQRLRGDYTAALTLYDQSLTLHREIGNRAMECTILNNLATTAYAKGDYTAALTLYDHSLTLHREVGNRAMEGTTLNNIGPIYLARGDYTAALKHMQRSFIIFREIDDKTGEGTALNNIGEIYRVRKDFTTALTYLEQSLSIRRKISDNAGEAATLNNISLIYREQGDYTVSLNYLEQSLTITRKIGDRAGEGTTLNNLATIAYAKGDDTTALTYLELSLVINQEIGDRQQEAITSWNIGVINEEQGDLNKAEQYMSRTVKIDEEIGRAELKWERKELGKLRARIEGRLSPLARLLQLLLGR